MNVIKINTDHVTTRVVTDATLAISNEEAKFLFHAQRKIQRLWNEHTLSDNGHLSANIVDEIEILTAKINELTMPSLEAILIPVEDVDSFLKEFNPHTNSVKTESYDEQPTYTKKRP